MATGGINSSRLNLDLSEIKGDFVIVAALWHSDIVDNLTEQMQKKGIKSFGVEMEAQLPMLNIWRPN